MGIEQRRWAGLLTLVNVLHRCGGTICAAPILCQCKQPPVPYYVKRTSLPFPVPVTGTPLRRHGVILPVIPHHILRRGVGRVSGMLVCRGYQLQCTLHWLVRRGILQDSADVAAS